MTAVPTEHQVQINHINEIKIKSENRKLKLRIYSNIDNDDQPLIIFLIALLASFMQSIDVGKLTILLTKACICPS